MEGYRDPFETQRFRMLWHHLPLLCATRQNAPCSVLVVK